MKVRMVFLWCGLVITAAMNSRAQETPEPYKPVFDQVIPKVTGNNGYEELVLAGDLVASNRAFADLIDPSITPLRLSVIKKVLQDRDLVRARELLRVGLSKPVNTPREKIDDETPLGEFRGFRQLARLLMLSTIVDFADGRINRAIDTLHDGLKFGYVIQTDSLISGLVGVAVDALTLRPFEDHLEQLSAPDCDRLIAVARDWLRLPDPLLTVINAERQAMRSLFQKYRANPEKLVQILGADPQSEEYKKADATLAQVKSSQGGVGPVFDEAASRMDAHFDRLLAEMRKSPWERQELPDIEDKTPAGRLCGMLAPTVGARVSDRYVMEQARVQLLAVYAAVRRYWWEHFELPPSLAAINPGPLAIDPFTGQPFGYKIKGEKDFELGSIGPLDRRSDEPGKRIPLSLPVKR